MKKLLSFLQSMKFGMILLILVMLCSLAGSLISQQAAPMTYVQEYGAETASVLIFIGFTDVFHTWYFCALLVMLCVNLIFCSIVRFSRTVHAAEQLRERSAKTAPDTLLPAEQLQALQRFLKMRGFKEAGDGNGGKVYSRHGIGYFGSFLTHLAILLVLAFGSLVLMTPTITDVTVMPGSTLTLEDGTLLTCESFHIMDATGRLDYASALHAESPDGKQSKDQLVRVNEPLRFGEYKVYQNTYGTAGRVKVINHVNGAEETFYMTEPSFLSIDGMNGLYYVALYPGYLQDEEGSMTLITSSATSYEDPVYDVRVISDGMSSSVLAFPDETITIGDISFTMLSPAEYPGLRIKRVSSVLFGGLYFSFGLMVLALYLCFFTVPVCVHVTDTGYVISSPKEQNGLLTDFEATLMEKEAP